MMASALRLRASSQGNLMRTFHRFDRGFIAMNSASKLAEKAKDHHDFQKPGLDQMQFSEDWPDAVRISSSPDAYAGSWPLSAIKGFLIDLDGTMYTPTGAIDGAKAFHHYLVENDIPYVFCSNTGAKGAQGVQVKLAKTGIVMPSSSGVVGTLVPTDNIYTAAQAQCTYMANKLPRGAKVFVFAGGNDSEVADSFWMQILRRRDADLVDSWDVRTFLTERDAKAWAKAAAAADDGGNGQSVFVVLFSDGSINACRDPSTGELGFADWSFDVIKKAGYLLSHGAEFISTAEDAFNVQVDGFPTPGPGMIIAMFRKLMYPLGRARLRVCGKGGSEGDKFMMDHAISLLKKQGHSGNRDEIMMVGDRFDTDVRAGAKARVRTCLVESGAHSIALQRRDHPTTQKMRTPGAWEAFGSPRFWSFSSNRYFPSDRAHFVATSVAELIPPPG